MVFTSLQRFTTSTRVCRDIAQGRLAAAIEYLSLMPVDYQNKDTLAVCATDFTTLVWMSGSTPEFPFESFLVMGQGECQQRQIYNQQQQQHGQQQQQQGYEQTSTSRTSIRPTSTSLTSTSPTPAAPKQHWGSTEHLQHTYSLTIW